MAHSLSPVLHQAAYPALGLTGWTYERIEADAAALPDLGVRLDESWAGLSVTMPGKQAALSVATDATARAVAVGAANTLVRGVRRWRADCTDVDGVVGALRARPGLRPARRRYGVVLGAGGTACAALAGLVDLGVGAVYLVVRDPPRGRAGACGCARSWPAARRRPLGRRRRGRELAAARRCW